MPTRTPLQLEFLWKVHANLVAYVGDCGSSNYTEKLSPNRDSTGRGDGGFPILFWGGVPIVLSVSQRSLDVQRNVTTQQFVLLVLWLNKYSMKFPDDVLDLLIEAACLRKAG